MYMLPPISLCIATMKRWDFLKNYLPDYLNNPYIHEIVICDETGEDVKTIKEIYGSVEKIKLYTNEKRMGPFLNKEKVVRLASNDWVCLVDSDNFVPLTYFEALDTFLVDNNKTPNQNIIYCPSRASGFVFNEFLGLEIDGKNAKQIYNNPNGTILFNTGNYILHKSLMNIPIPEGHEDYPMECLAMDVLYRNYLCLAKGVKLCVVPNMEYIHTIHDGSFWIQSHKQIDKNIFEELLFSLSDYSN